MIITMLSWQYCQLTNMITLIYGTRHRMYRSRISIFLSFVLLASTAYSGTKTGTLSCEIINRKSNQPVPGARICFRTLNRCKNADSSGIVIFDAIPVGIYTIVASAVGFDTTIRHDIVVNHGNNTTISLALPERIAISTLDTLRVHSGRLHVKKAELINAVVQLSNFDLKKTPGTADDIYRVMQSQPSVIQGGIDMDNSMYVRGGHSCENIFIVDGIVARTSFKASLIIG